MAENFLNVVKRTIIQAQELQSQKKDDKTEIDNKEPNN